MAMKWDAFRGVSSVLHKPVCGVLLRRVRTLFGQFSHLGLSLCLFA
jgi:hypothetical protein